MSDTPETEPPETRPPSPPFGQADAPFDQADADIILRSSDFFDFRVHKTILSVASPVFKDMLNQPQPAQPTGGDLPIIMLEEDAKTLDFILRTVYPVRSPRISQLDELHSIIAPSQKYALKVFDGFVEESLRDALQQEPISVYAIACQFGFADVAAAAAETSLELPLMTHSRFLKYISGEQYYRLVQYHCACVDAVRKALTSSGRTLHSGSPCSICFTKGEELSQSSKTLHTPLHLWRFSGQPPILSNEKQSRLTIRTDQNVVASIVLHCRHSSSSVDQAYSDHSSECRRILDTTNDQDQTRQFLSKTIRWAIGTVCTNYVQFLRLPLNTNHLISCMSKIPSPKICKEPAQIAVPQLSEIKDALPPFSRQANSDLILRSSDHVDFRVHKLILSIASPIFEDMFSLPQTSQSIDEHRDGLPIVMLEEDAQTVDFMLRTIYPVPSPVITKLDDLRFVLGPSQKYLFNVYGGFAEESLNKALNWEPISVYALACQYKYPGAAAKAAEASLALPLTAHSHCLDNIRGEQYHRLLLYRQKCVAATTDVVSSTSWFQPIPATVLENSTTCGCYTQARGPSASQKRWYGPSYLWTYLTRVGLALRETPSSQCIIADKGDDLNKVFSCGHYGYSSPGYKDTTKGFTQFCQLLVEKVNRAVAQVNIDLYFLSSARI